MDSTSKAKSIISEYNNKSDKIIDRMLDVIVKASKKSDNIHYQRILDQVNKEIASK